MTLGADVTVQATFSQTAYTLSVVRTGTGAGSVSSVPGGIDCSPANNDCGEAYSQGTTVLLTAAPDSNSQFGGWSGGGCTGPSPCLRA